jgi:hypothetical protein
LQKVQAQAEARRLAVLDGAGGHQTVWPYFHQSPDWAGFVGKFPRIRPIETKTGTMHIRKYLSQLPREDFEETAIAGTIVWSHALTAKVPSFPFLGAIQFVVIQDEPGNLHQHTFRVLITDVLALRVDQMLLISGRRWKQETSHHIVKDRLGARSYKHRKLKALIRFLELVDGA